MTLRGRPIRVLVSKPGLDGHDRGAKAVVQALRDAGMEVIYTGLHQRAEDVARAALQEDVDVVGLSVLSGNHVVLSRAVADELRTCGLTDVKLVVGGAIPHRDFAALHEAGVDEVFPMGAKFGEMIEWIEANGRKRNLSA